MDFLRLRAPALRAALLALVLLAAGRLSADASVARADESPVKVYAADTHSDTLDASFDEARAAARDALLHARWEISPSDTARGRLVTAWKPMNHPLARLTLGTVHARCVVNFTGLSTGRTLVTLNGAIATSRDVDGNPALALARASYDRAADHWFERVRDNIVRARGLGDAKAAPADAGAASR